MHPKLTALEATFAKSILTEFTDPSLDKYNLQLWLKRDDLIHPVISGNKWRKLKYPLDHALSLGADSLISMGGAYSNHLHALAYVGQALGLDTAGIVRGEQPAVLNQTLQDMKAWGMQFKFMSREEFRRIRQHKHWQELPGIEPNQYWLPEGGSSPLALKGVAESAIEIDIPYDTLCVPCGTGTTLAGLINAVPDSITLYGFSALKTGDFLINDINKLLPTPKVNWHLISDYNFGGFAKLNHILEEFIMQFEEQTLISLEPIYTAKMMYGIIDLAKKGFFKPGSRIIALHTGGLQGKRGFA
jgi:1-aminocyclopropane-1-carboxylate deaminase